MSVLRFPYTDLHTLNLDWIIEQLNKEGAVLSVNDKHGVVVLTGEDIKRNTTTPETVAQALTSQGTAIQTVRTQIGTTPLPTVAQSLTGAIAENAGEIADIQDNVIGSTALPTTAQTLTGAIAENAGDINTNATNIGTNTNDISGINTKIGTTALPTTAQTLTGAISEHETDITSVSNTLTTLNTPEDHKITNTGEYFNERDAFKARRVGYTVQIYSYVQITTEVPNGTNFADIHISNAEGVFLFVAGSTIKVVSCTSGLLRPDGALPTGYYYAIGSALAPQQ